MAVENFFISTAFRIGDFVKYFSYPFFKVTSMALTKNERASDAVAGGAAALTYGGLTAHYTGMELENYDRMVRMAYAAEKGIEPERVNVSDYLNSKNPIIRHRAELGAQLMKVRYPASLLPLLPSAIDMVLDYVPAHLKETVQHWRRIRPKESASALEHIINGNKVDNHAVYAAFAALYIYEQFIVRKSGIYDAAKLQETKHDVARKVSADDLIGIYNRGRKDGGRDMILSKADRNALWPILERMASHMNRSEHFDIPETIYLLGLDLINPFKRDEAGQEIKDANGNSIVAEGGVEGAIARVDHVARVGLRGIIDEKRAARSYAPAPTSAPRNFTEKLNGGLLNTQMGFAARFTPDILRPTEEISSRDPVR